ncbi:MULTISPECIES: hypothetical protein [Lelliottia]|jgi:hypothetical protein|nr:MULTISPECIES: hypothetical protein [Lelliottia]
MDETQEQAVRALAVIRYVNTWKKLIIFMVLVTFCASGYSLKPRF